MRRRPPLAALLGFGAVLLLAAPAAAQSLTIPEYRELILANEGKLARVDRDLAAANALLDRLVREKDARGSPVDARSRQLSAEIVAASERLTELERQKRMVQADLRALRSALHARYTAVIAANFERLGEMQQGDAGYADLLIETGRYVASRDTLQLKIRIQESVGSFREYPILPTDGPTEIREKAGFYRDYVRDIDGRIEAIDREVDQLEERERVARRMREFVEDLVFQGEAVPDRPGGDPVGGDLREEPTLTGSEALEVLGRSPAQQVDDLQQERRQLELLRRQFLARVRDYDERARTIYSRQTTEPGGRSR